MAALTGICKSLVELDDAASGNGEAPILDHSFISAHTSGFDQFIAWLRQQEWPELERRAGLPRASMEATAAVYARSTATMGIYGMGLTQHRAGVETVQMLVNLLLLRGNIGRFRGWHLPGARPQQRAGPAHRRYHGKAVAGAAGQACRAVSFQSAARSRDTIPSRLAKRSLRTRSRPSSC